MRFLEKLVTPIGGAKEVGHELVCAGQPIEVMSPRQNTATDRRRAFFKANLQYMNGSISTLDTFEVFPAPHHALQLIVALSDVRSLATAGPFAIMDLHYLTVRSDTEAFQ